MINFMSQKIDLLLCPFCGGEAILLHENLGVNISSYIKCLGCGVETDKFQISTDHSCDDKAVESWNRRKQNG